MLEGLPPNGASHVLRLTCDERRARAVADIIVETFDPTETAAAAFEEENGAYWAVEIYFAEAPDEQSIRELIAAVSDQKTAHEAQFSQIAKQDWVQNALSGLKPVRAGRILVHGAHDRAHKRSNDIGVEIEAALAFGTGHHGTTLGCLRALDQILKRRRPRQILDVGTGTGVLAIAAARLLRQTVASGDIDEIRGHLLAVGRDVAGVLAGYRAQNFFLAQRGDIDGWATLRLSRGGASPILYEDDDDYDD